MSGRYVSLVSNPNPSRYQPTEQSCHSSIPKSAPSRLTLSRLASSSPLTDDDIRGKWAVFFFYPADFTFVCPTELEDLADNYAEFQKMGVEIYSVSTDTHFSHKAWHDSSDAIGKIEYTMLGDPTGAISRNFQVMIEEAGLANRGTFLIDPERYHPGGGDHR